MEWIRKLDPSSCVDAALRGLEVESDYHPKFRYPHHICTMILDLRYFKMLFWGLEYDEESTGDDLHCHLRVMAKELGLEADLFSFSLLVKKMRKEVIADWGALSCCLENTIQKCKEETNETCTLVLRGAFKCNLCKSCQSEGPFLAYSEHTVYFMDLILQNLWGLESMINLIAPVKQQVAYVKRKLKMFREFTYAAQHSRNATSSECISHTLVWAKHISCLVCLYWINGVDEGLASTTENMLSNLMQGYMPYTPRVISLYLDICKAKRSHIFQGDGGMLQLPVSDYVDYLFEHLMMHQKDNTGILELLRYGLISLLSFLVDPPVEDSEEKELILVRVDDIIDEVPSIICTPAINLSSFLHKIDEVNGLIRELCVHSPIPSEFNSPQTNAIGFVDSLLGNLKNMLEGKVKIIPSMREHIVRVQEALISLQALLEVNLEVESEHGDLWAQIVNLAYFSAYITNLCSTTHFPVWYGILCLPKLVRDIEEAKSAVIKKVDDGKVQMSSQRRRTIEMVKSSSNARQVRVPASDNEGTFIGFEEDAEDILNWLLRGRGGLTIISISGMAGGGKTTLAKRIFNDPSIRLYFHHTVWCYVSKECEPRDLLKHIAGCEVSYKLEGQELIEALWRSLKGLRYLIVLDDIWNVDFWRQVEGIFPNDGNGSRILFTSRNHHLASQADPNSISYHLRPFSDRESWELMKDKLSMSEGLPEAVLEIGERIAVYCQGMPLAVALISSHLNTIPHVVELWEQVAENLKTHLASGGCMHAIELSYIYLPEHLKPCFLYLGTFPRKKDIRAKQLKLLWIAEGFVKGNEMQLATEYLNYLVSRCLVVVTLGSSTGGIKECRIHHDLLYDLCLEQAVKDNFLHVPDEHFALGTKSNDFHHRLCLQGQYNYNPPKSTGARGGLPPSQIHTILYYHYHIFHGSACEAWYHFLKNFRVLTVLALEHVPLRKFPKMILRNIHLRYLALAFYADYCHIPATIVDLWNLETLVVKSALGVQIPDTLWGMENLKHVYLEKSRFHLKATWPNLSSIPTGVVCNVEVLKGIILKYNLETEDFLRRLVKLRKMRCRCDEKEVIHPMWFTMFGSLEKLESLHLCYIAKRNGSTVFQKLPTLNFPCNLKKLVLFRFGLPWSAMSAIGKLPNLRVLKLLFSACIGSTWHLRDGEFLKLIYLKLDFMDVERIDDSACDDPFPCLRGLIVRRCTKLKEIPSSFGDICSLEVIDIHLSPRVADSVKRILEQQREMGNDSFQVFGLKDEVATDEKMELDITMKLRIQ